MTITWQLINFPDLKSTELYEIIKLRNEVFVVEQNCVFQDADDKDQGCFHLLGWVNNNLAAYARLVPPGHIYTYPSIGRIITSPKYRRFGFGKQLLEKSIAACEKLYGKQTIKIGAQLYLKKFYEGFGFVQAGDGYDEDGIPHNYMLREWE